MQNKQNNIKKFALQVLSISGLYLALPVLVAVAQTVPVETAARAALAVPIGLNMPMAAPATATPTAASNPTQKLTYRAAGTDLTIKDLAAAQRKKLEDDFFLKANYTDVAPIDPRNIARPKVENITPMLSLNVIGIYGPPASQKVDLSIDGVLHTLTPYSQIGKLRIESIVPGRVVIAYSKTKASAENAEKTKASKPAKGSGARTVRATLKAGDFLEIPA